MEGPSFLQIEPSAECNLRCQMCSLQFRREGPPYGSAALLPWDLYTYLLDEFPTARQLHLQGLGEPLLHPRFFEMVAYAAGQGIRVSTSTNLTVLTPRRIDECLSCGLDTLHVSIDAARPHVYERIRRNAHYAQIMRTMDQLVAARAHSGEPRPRIHLVVVAMRQNLADLPVLVHMAAQWELDEVFVQHLCHSYSESSLPDAYRPMRDFVQAESLLTADPAQVQPYFDQAAATAHELTIPLRLPRLQPRVWPSGATGRKRCDWPWRGLYLSYRGEAAPCCMVSTPERAYMGNAAQEGAALWENESYRSFRNRLDLDDPPEVCRACSVYRGMF